jgi:hypothetical protein
MPTRVGGVLVTQPPRRCRLFPVKADSASEVEFDERYQAAILTEGTDGRSPGPILECVGRPLSG